MAPQITSRAVGAEPRGRAATTSRPTCPCAAAAITHAPAVTVRVHRAALWCDLQPRHPPRTGAGAAPRTWRNLRLVRCPRRVAATGGLARSKLRSKHQLRREARRRLAGGHGAKPVRRGACVVGWRPAGCHHGANFRRGAGLVPGQRPPGVHGLRSRRRPALPHGAGRRCAVARVAPRHRLLGVRYIFVSRARARTQRPICVPCPVQATSVYSGHRPCLGTFWPLASIL